MKTNRYSFDTFRVISYNRFGTECIHEGSYDECYEFCKSKDWKFIDKNKQETILQIF